MSESVQVILKSCVSSLHLGAADWILFQLHPPPPTFYITFLCFPVSACAVGGKNVGGRLQVMTLGLLIESEEFRSVLVPTEVLGA